MLTTVEYAAEKSKVQFFQQFLHGQPMMGCDELEDTFESAKAKWCVIGHGHMILTGNPGSEPDVRSILPGAFIAQDAKGFDQISSGDVPGGFHAARTSSRTK
jgi:hypothetical protein